MALAMIAMAAIPAMAFAISSPSALAGAGVKRLPAMASPAIVAVSIFMLAPHGARFPDLIAPPFVQRPRLETDLAPTGRDKQYRRLAMG